MKNLLNTLMLIGLLLVFTSSTTSNEVIATESSINLTEECAPLASPSLSEFIGPAQMVSFNEDPFCFYYYLLADLYCDDPQTASDIIQCNYYLTKIALNCIPQ